MDDGTVTVATRRPTRQITLAHPTHPVAVGGGAPVSIQSMTTTKTADVEGTLQQVYALYGAGADIVRCTCNDADAAAGLAHIVPRSPVPIVVSSSEPPSRRSRLRPANRMSLPLSPNNCSRVVEVGIPGAPE